MIYSNNLCFICKKIVKGNLGLSKHLSNSHDVSVEDYVIKYKHNNIQPTCKCGCGLSTKFRKSGFFDFNSFLRGHRNEEVKEKIEKGRRETSLKKFGTVCCLQNEKVKKKTKKTNKEKYGTTHYSKTEEYKNKIKKTNLKRYGTEYYTQSLKYKHLRKRMLLDWEIILRYCRIKNYNPLFSFKDYKGNRTILKFKCNIHNIKFEAKIVNIQRLKSNQCPKCKNKTVSRGEKNVASFVRQFVELKENIKTIIPPNELDIYIPNKNIAIEYNGLYWHCELNKPRNYHYRKFLLCKEKNIELLQIYEDEWRDKRDIWESILKNKFNLIKNKLNARELLFFDAEITKKVRQFLDENHLQGYCRSKKKFVLTDRLQNIVFCVTFRKPFARKDDKTIEIARVCSKNNTIVRGGFSKIMKYAIEWAKSEGYEKILTYSDCRYSWGKAYENNGFSCVGHTDVGYDYTDLINRYGRFQFRAQNGKSEKEVAEENDIFKIYNSGNHIWKYNII